MDRECIESLRNLWETETADEETQEWRDNLTPEEARLVESWDRSWDSGALRLCEDIIELDQRLAAQRGAGSRTQGPER